MKLTALCTIIGQDEKKAAPQAVFETADFGISDAEAETLVARGFAAEFIEEAPAKALTKAEKAAAEKAEKEAAAAAAAAEKEAADKAAAESAAAGGDGAAG